MIVCKLSDLMGRHRILKISELSKSTGINRNTLTNMYYNKVERIDLSVINTLCKYFDCKIDNLFQYIDEDIKLFVEDNQLEKKIEFEIYVSKDFNHIPFRHYSNSTTYIRSLAKLLVQNIDESLNKGKIEKNIIITNNQFNAGRLYEQIISLKPDWHSPTIGEGIIKIFTQDTINSTNKTLLKNRINDVNDKLQLLIIVDMWRQNFSFEKLNTIYLNREISESSLIEIITKLKNDSKENQYSRICDLTGSKILKQVLGDYTHSVIF